MASEKIGANTAEYCCPGQLAPISRSVHLGRMARFYPSCRLCAHRDDTGTLSPKHIKRLVETRSRAQRPELFGDEGAAGVCINDISPDVARRLAAAFAITLREGRSPEADPPAVVIASDGRAMMPQLVAALGEGLRWAGCNVVDAGEATAACLAFGIGQLGADGGVLLGNPTALSQIVGIKVWAAAGRPLSRGDGLDAVEQAFVNGVDRPARKYGGLQRLQIDGHYLHRLAEHYHALRPLRFVMLSGSLPATVFLRRLTEPVDCQMLPCPTRLAGLPQQILAEKAHFGLQLADDGETAEFSDEQGSPIPALRLFNLIARHLEREKATIASSSSCRAEIYRAMVSQGAILGGGPSGRFWYLLDRQPLADALMTLTLLLEILSRSDRPLSRVLDVDVPVT